MLYKVFGRKWSLSTRGKVLTFAWTDWAEQCQASVTMTHIPVRTEPRTSQNNWQRRCYITLNTQPYINVQRIYIYICRKYVYCVGILLPNWIRIRNWKWDYSTDESLLQSNSLILHGHAVWSEGTSPTRVVLYSADEETCKKVTALPKAFISPQSRLKQPANCVETPNAIFIFVTREIYYVWTA
jgi:hypothetical protein